MIAAKARYGTAGFGRIGPDGARRGAAALVGVAALAAAGAIALLVSTQRWYVALALLIVVPAFVVLHRYPMVTVTVWMVLLPFVAVNESGAARKVFWLIHRGLPVATLAAVVLGSLAGARARNKARLGPAEFIMAGYLLATLVSIIYMSTDAHATTYLLYDRVFIPMCLYLIVRLVVPGERALKMLLPAVVFVLLTQSFIGLLSWTVPEVLPSEWLGKVGERTVGSLRSVDVFGTTVLFCGVFVLHAGLSAGRAAIHRIWSLPLFVLAMVMVFMTFSRATWLAATLAVLGTLYIYRRFAARVLAILAVVVIFALASGLLTEQLQFARQRLRSEQSEESALSRLPIMYAAVQMFEAKPLFGWGYESFDRFDRRFQGTVANLVYPGKDHASHNLYLTILAEQGIVGITLFLAPVVYWLFKTRSAVSKMPSSGFLSRRLMAILWLVILAHVVVNNFSRMQISFGLGLWWLTLGVIASVVDRYRGGDEGSGSGARSTQMSPAEHEVAALGWSR